MYGMRFIGNAFVAVGIVSGVASGVMALLTALSPSITWGATLACGCTFLLGVLSYAFGGIILILQNLSEKP